MYHAITERIEELWKMKNFRNRTDFADRLSGFGIKPSGFGRWWHTDTPPSTATLIAISQLVRDVNLHWLITGTGEPLIKETESPLMEKKPPYLEYLELEARVSVRTESLERDINLLKEELQQMKRIITQNISNEKQEIAKSGRKQSAA